MSTGTLGLVERGGQLAVMTDAADRSRQGGELILVSGEAGHGKTSLIHAFRSRLDHRYNVLLGACDPVSVPTPFAPLFELLDVLPAELGDEIRNGEGRHDVYAGLLAVLEAEPTVLIIEDLHWADEVTLGLVRYLGRRLERTTSLLVLSYRPEEIDTTHPLLVVLADMGPLATTVDLPPLTIEGVREMASGLDVDPDQVHRASLGNPFFVDEILAHRGEQLPATIEAAVMASVGKLPTGSLDLLEMVALSPEGLDIAVAERHSPETAGNIDAAYRRRLLIEEKGRLRCRHDLIRLTVDNSIPPARRRRIHLRLLEALESSPLSRGAMARLAHHSVEAGEAEKAIQYSLAAASIAEAEGANRQARLHYVAALRFRESMDRDTLDSTLLSAADVHCAVNYLPEATTTARERLAFATDDVDLANRLAWSAFFASRWGNVKLAREDATRAIEILGDREPSEAHGMARSVLATLTVWEGDWATARALAEDAMDLALDSRAGRAQASLMLGKSGFMLGDPDWESYLETAADLAVEAGSLETACSALNSLAFLTLWRMDCDGAVERFDRGIEFASNHEMDAWYVAMTASKAACDLAQGRWDDARLALERAIPWPTCASTDSEARIHLASLKGRTGEEGDAGAVAEALESADQQGTYSERVIAAVLGLEAAWLGLLDRHSAIERYERLLSEGVAASDPNAMERLGLWTSLLGHEVGSNRDKTTEARARFWAGRGFEFESLLLQAMAPEPPLPEIFSRLEEMGGDGVMRALRRHLGQRGMRGIPRGARPSTSENPAGLTRRQVEVLTLLARGYTNRGIAETLYISEKTVGHHVSAILDKLDVSNRGQAAVIAIEHGLI